MACARSLALVKAGEAMLATRNSGMIRRNTAETIDPASARPPPVRAPLLFFIWLIATMPRINPTREATPQVMSPQSPSTNDAMASPLVLGAGAAGENVEGGDAGENVAAGDAARGANREANSGKVPSGFHSPPSDCALDCALRRPCAIHWIIC